ncbi:tyrosine-type recombinase/integrase [Pseudonocardia sp.]|uniref:tyrosine-type recombinase/integrase n=1 Tax=Pseudonocardia sp. TaxID=60912 RepID=UPI003D0D532E
MTTTTFDQQLIDRHCRWFDLNGATPISVGHRRENLRRLAAALPSPLLEATPADLLAWQSALRSGVSRLGTPYKMSTLSTYTSNARAFYAWALEAELIDTDPTKRMAKIKVPAAHAHPVPDRDLKLAIQIAPEPMRTWLVLAAFMGLRAMEIAQLTRDSIDEIEGRLVLSGIGKGRKPFRITVPLHVEPSLRQYMHMRGPLFWTRFGNVMKPATLSKLVGQFFARQGMPYSLHWLRHSFGTAFYASTRDLLLTQDVMRHASPNTTRLYVRTTGVAATKAMDRLSKSLRPPRPARRGLSQVDGETGAAA